MQRLYFHKSLYPLGERIQRDYESNPELNKKLNTLGKRIVFDHHHLRRRDEELPPLRPAEKIPEWIVQEDPIHIKLTL